MNYEIISGIFIGFIIVAGILIVTGVAVMLFSIWKIFEKAGLSGWKSIIPIYNIYLYITKISKKSFICFLIPCILLAIFCKLGTYTPNIFQKYGNDGYSTVLVIYTGLILSFMLFLVFYMRISYSVARNFGYGVIFAMGLMFFPVIFFLILALNSSVFIPDKKNE
ncbi:hypothetical protein [Fusobacterium sp. PH5-44]|uniref:hypothetical protein n=1 Tax=unclassified Fusobacterium TaxID=2648384 RepID=UPI003D19D3E2